MEFCLTKLLGGTDLDHQRWKFQMNCSSLMQQIKALFFWCHTLRSAPRDTDHVWQSLFCLRPDCIGTNEPSANKWSRTSNNNGGRLSYIYTTVGWRSLLPLDWLQVGLWNLIHMPVDINTNTGVTCILRPPVVQIKDDVWLKWNAFTFSTFDCTLTLNVGVHFKFKSTTCIVWACICTW